MMKPKGQTEHDSGMLEYLEDIIGTSRYKVYDWFMSIFVEIWKFVSYWVVIFNEPFIFTTKNWYNLSEQCVLNLVNKFSLLTMVLVF